MSRRCAVGVVLVLVVALMLALATILDAGAAPTFLSPEPTPTPIMTPMVEGSYYKEGVITPPLGGPYGFGPVSAPYLPSMGGDICVVLTHIEHDNYAPWVFSETRKANVTLDEAANMYEAAGFRKGVDFHLVGHYISECVGFDPIDGWSGSWECVKEIEDDNNPGTHDYSQVAADNDCDVVVSMWWSPVMGSGWIGYAYDRIQDGVRYGYAVYSRDPLMLWNDTNRYVAHEVGHMFNAADQYSATFVLPCDEGEIGEWGIVNGNSMAWNWEHDCPSDVPSIMRGGDYFSMTIDRWMIGHMGLELPYPYILPLAMRAYSP